jgi:hypothetical protein
LWIPAQFDNLPPVGSRVAFSPSDSPRRAREHATGWQNYLQLTPAAASSVRSVGPAWALQRPSPPSYRYSTLRKASQELTPEYLAKCDAIVAVTDHSAYDWDFILKHAGLTIDTRNVTKECVASGAKVAKA